MCVCAYDRRRRCRCAARAGTRDGYVIWDLLGGDCDRNNIEPESFTVNVGLLSTRVHNERTYGYRRPR